MPGTKAKEEISRLIRQRSFSRELLMQRALFGFDSPEAKRREADSRAKIKEFDDRIAELSRNDPYLKGMSWIP